jgi:hypothetical protein
MSVISVCPVPFASEYLLVDPLSSGFPILAHALSRDAPAQGRRRPIRRGDLTLSLRGEDAAFGVPRQLGKDLNQQQSLK